MFFLPNLKDSVSLHHKSFLIYKFQYKHDVCYIGHTTQIFEDSIKQHVPLTIWSHSLTSPTRSHNQNALSTTIQHLLANPWGISAYNISMFSIQDTAGTNQHWKCWLELDLMEADWYQARMPGSFHQIHVSQLKPTPNFKMALCHILTWWKVR